MTKIRKSGFVLAAGLALLSGAATGCKDYLDRPPQGTLNALTLAMAIELESTGIKVNAVSPGFTRTNLNNYTGTETVEEGAAEAVRVALLGPDGPTGTFTHGKLGTVPW